MIKNWWKRSPKKVKIKGTQTTFEALANYRKYLNGEMTQEEYAQSKGETTTQEFEEEITIYPEE